MHRHSLTRTFLACGVALVASVAAVAAQYTMTVNKDRLINAQNEPQNWLMRAGNYSNWNNSKLAEINRGNVGNLKVK